MAPKKNAASSPSRPLVPSSTASPAHGQTSASSAPAKTASKASAKSAGNASLRNANDAQEVVAGVWNRYVQDTPQRVKLIDVFLGFLIVVGLLQFVYCVIAGNYVRPFFSRNAPI